MSRCGIVILAAGGSTRMGFPKQLVRIDGVTLLRRIVDRALASVCNPVVVVLGCGAGQLRSELDGLGVTIAVNDGWESGMGSSIRRGVEAMLETAPDLDAVLIALCDQPHMTAAVFDRLVARQRESGKMICASGYSGTFGTPVVYARALFAELLSLPDRSGGRTVIQKHWQQTETVEVPEATVDLDTPMDLQRFAGQ